MKKVASSRFIVWEGDTYRLDRISGDGIELFILKSGKFVPISSKLTATVLFEGKESTETISHSGENQNLSKKVQTNVRSQTEESNFSDQTAGQAIRRAISKLHK